MTQAQTNTVVVGNRRGTGPFISAMGWLLLIALSLGVFLVTWPDVPLLISLPQILLGWPFWTWCFSRALRVRHRIGWLWIVIAAPLARQLTAVMLPAVLLCFSIDPARLEQTYITLLPRADVSHASILMTLGNYTMFFTLLIGLPWASGTMSGDLSRYHSPFYLFLFGLTILGTGLALAFYVQTVIAVGGTTRAIFGSSVARDWGTVGMALVLLRFWPKHAQKGLSWRHWIMWGILALGVVMPLVGTGSRGALLQPFSVLIIFGLVWLRDRLRWWHIPVAIVGGVILLTFVFSLIAVVRQEHYGTGHAASLSEVVASPMAPVEETLQDVGFRLGAMLLSTELAYSRPYLFPDRDWSHVLANFVVAFDNRFFRISNMLDLDIYMRGLGAGQYLMEEVYGYRGSSAWPLEAEAYLGGGWAAVIVGWVIMGAIYCAWMVVFRCLRLHPVSVMAITLGSLAPAATGAELAPYIIALVTYRLLVLTIILWGWQLLFIFIRAVGRRSNSRIEKC